jgi:glycosyltransferase involved in cell wall biosynthesis
VEHLPEKYPLGISVVICCYNSEKRIEKTLEHLALQKANDVPWEIILVDNNCKDNTVATANAYWKELGLTYPDLKVVQELNPGLIHARNRGISEARFKYILFCDDDNWLDCEYLDIAYKLVSGDSAIASLGGSGEPIYEQFQVTSWFPPFAGLLATGPQGKGGLDIDGESKGCLYGAGIVLNRTILDYLHDLGFASTLSGRKESSLSSGEDTELSFALGLLNAKQFYSSKLRFKHLIPQFRTEWSYLRRLSFSIGRSDFYLSSFFASKKKYNWIVLVLTNFIVLVRSWRRAFLASFEAGKKEVLIYERMKGQFYESFFHYRKFKENIHRVQALKKSIKDATNLSP